MKKTDVQAETQIDKSQEVDVNEECEANEKGRRRRERFSVISVLLYLHLSHVSYPACCLLSPCLLSYRQRDKAVLGPATDTADKEHCENFSPGFSTSLCLE